MLSWLHHPFISFFLSPYHVVHFFIILWCHSAMEILKHQINSNFTHIILQRMSANHWILLVRKLRGICVINHKHYLAFANISSCNWRLVKYKFRKQNLWMQALLIIFTFLFAYKLLLEWTTTTLFHHLNFKSFLCWFWQKKIFSIFFFSSSFICSCANLMLIMMWHKCRPSIHHVYPTLLCTIHEKGKGSAACKVAFDTLWLNWNEIFMMSLHIPKQIYIENHFERKKVSWAKTDENQTEIKNK